MRNYSKQREAILNVLCACDSHPTAREVYEMVRKQIPNISLGTVYRNLSALSAVGDILCISVGDGFEHYDGNTHPHLHLLCRKCGHIKDAPLSNTSFLEDAKRCNFIPDSQVCVVYGICSKCKNNG